MILVYYLTAFGTVQAVGQLSDRLRDHLSPQATPSLQPKKRETTNKDVSELLTHLTPADRSDEMPTEVGTQEVAPVSDPLVWSYGHLPYAETNQTDLMIIASYSKDTEQRFERLHVEAGLELLKMMDAARLDGVWLIPVSGFRDMARQAMLFQLETEHLGSEEAAARAVAPPGYSEHHTGYAVDLADGLARAFDVSLSFGQTKAFAWLMTHAHEFGFELSFPLDNPQGVNYEPWHWRFVGSPNASRIFTHNLHNLTVDR
jgi:LAS superfamily LD-carboxypeptidase LdcB